MRKNNTNTQISLVSLSFRQLWAIYSFHTCINIDRYTRARYKIICRVFLWIFPPGKKEKNTRRQRRGLTGQTYHKIQSINFSICLCFFFCWNAVPHPFMALFNSRLSAVFYIQLIQCDRFFCCPFFFLSCFSYSIIDL